LPESESHQACNSLLASFSLALLLAGCGNGTIVAPEPPPSGTYPIMKEAAPAWSHSGREIAFVKYRTDLPPDSLRNIWRADIGTGSVVFVTIGSSPAWSPDDSQLAFEWNSDIYRIRIASGTIVRVTSLGTCHNPTWTPTGRSIAFDLLPNGADIDAAASGIWEADTSGAPPTPVVQNAARYASWSQSPESLACCVPFGSTGRIYELCTFNVVTHELRRLTYDNADDTYPSWSPSGSHIAWTRRTLFAPQRSALYQVELGSGTAARIDTMVARPSWSPDASAMAVEAVDPATNTIFVYRRDMTTGILSRVSE
jgi:Tol biopolymer transport system component